jgi:DNA-binding NarL/FixJ family response regulator
MKILLADPHSEVQSALQLLLGQIPQVNSVCEATGLVDLLAQCAQSCPDLILIDPALIHPGRPRQQSLGHLIQVLRRLCPDSRILVMSSRFDVEQAVLEAGASGFLSKTDTPDAVISAILEFLEKR